MSYDVKNFIAYLKTVTPEKVAEYLSNSCVEELREIAKILKVNQDAIVERLDWDIPEEEILVSLIRFSLNN